MGEPKWEVRNQTQAAVPPIGLEWIEILQGQGSYEHVYFAHPQLYDKRLSSFQLYSRKSEICNLGIRNKCAIKAIG